MSSASPSPVPESRPASVKESGVIVRSAPLRGASVALRVLALCAAVATLHFAAPLLLPVVLAILLFYALNPIVNLFTRWWVPRALASVLVVAALVTGIGAGAVALWPQVDAVVAKIPDGAAKLRTTFRRARGGAPDSALERVQAAAKAIDSAAAEAKGPPSAGRGSRASRSSSPSACPTGWSPAASAPSA